MGYPDPTQSPYYRPPHDFDPVTPEERERIRIFEGRGRFPNTEGLDPFKNLPLDPPLPMPDPLRLTPDLDRREMYLEPRDPFIQDVMDSLINRGITEQNQEVMGSKEQVFPRYANPEDGTLNNEEMARVDPTDKLLLDSLRRGEIGPLTDPRIRKAIIDLERKIYNEGRASSMDGALMAADPSFTIPKEVSPQEVNQINRRVISDYDKKKEMLRRGFLAPLLRGV